MNWDDFFLIKRDVSLEKFLSLLRPKLLSNFINKKIPLAEAEDFTQEICLKIATNMEKIQESCQSGKHVKNYIYKMIKNFLLDDFRKNKHSSVSIESVERISLETPEQQMLQKEIFTFLYNCMAKLNPNWSELLIWKILEKKSSNEIQNDSGIPERTQRLWRDKARESLKTCMENNLKI